MSHRTALALSVILTLVLAAGILAGRERLFTLGATAGTISLTPAPSVSSDRALGETELSGKSVTSAAPRVIEIPLPVTGQEESLRQSSADERWERGDDRDDDDEDGGHEQYDDEDEHEEEDDD